MKAHYYIKRTAAYAVAPILRITGLRFSKAWRGNPIIDHVAANILADGVRPGVCVGYRF